MGSWEKWILTPLNMNQTNPLLTIPLNTMPPKSPRKFISQVQSSKETQDALDKARKLKKQDKLLFTVTQDVAHDVGPADHLHKSKWDYLEKYKNNHTTSSLPPTTRSNSSPDKRIWITGPPTLWHH